MHTNLLLENSLCCYELAKVIGHRRSFPYQYTLFYLSIKNILIKFVLYLRRFKAIFLSTVKYCLIDCTYLKQILKLGKNEKSYACCKGADAFNNIL